MRWWPLRAARVLPLVLAGFLASPEALAFCRSTTCSGDCERDADNCKTTGSPLFWRSGCVGFSIQADGTVNLPMADVRPVIERSFVTWSDLACAGGAASIAFSELDDAACHEANYDKDGPNANVVMFQDDKWRFDDIDDNIAKTTVTYDPSSGEIWDADIELNYAYNEFTIGDDDVAYDLESILTHEIGHFIGLDHSDDLDATMYAEYDEGTIAQRTLAKDDIAGACAIYPADRGAFCDPTPRGGFSGACADDAAGGDAPGGCSTSGGGAPFGGAGLVVVGAAVAVLRRRRRLAALASVAAIALFAACSSSESPPASSLCDPGSVVFCRCFDGEPGSKTCADGGDAFSHCLNQATAKVCDGADPATTSTGPSTTSSSRASTTTSSTGGGGEAATSSTASTGGGGAGGAGGSGGAAGGGGSAPTFGCPGAPLAVTLAADTSVGGDTSMGQDDDADHCGGAGAGEIVYAITPASSGTLTVSVTGVGSDPVVYARGGDCATGISLGCADATGQGGVETLKLQAVAGKVVYLFVDAKAGKAGPFSLNLHLEVGVPGDTCPGNPIALGPGDTVSAGGDTSVAGANYKGTGTCSTSSTKEIVYGVTPSSDGMLTVTLSPGFDAQLYARSGTCTLSSGPQLGCSDVVGVGQLETISFPVTAQTKYSVFVDGAAPAEAGEYFIDFHLD